MWNWVSKLEELKGEPLAIITVTSVKGATPRDTGAKMILLRDGAFFGTIGGGNLEKQALEAGQEYLKEGKTGSQRYTLCESTGQCCGGVVEIFVETLHTNPEVYIFGAGHVGQALARTLAGTIFSVHLIDERKEWIESNQIPKEVTCHSSHWNSVVKKMNWNKENSYAVVMTYSHGIDLEIIQELIERPARYIGLIGSKGKWVDFQLKLGKNGASKESLQRVHCPVGIPSGGKTPQEIAISIATELIQDHYETAAALHKKKKSLVSVG